MVTWNRCGLLSHFVVEETEVQSPGRETLVHGGAGAGAQLSSPLQ